MVKWGSKLWFKNLILAILVGIGVISFWRGIWHLQDTYIMPSNFLASGIISIVMGLVILIMTHKTLRELM